MRLKKDMKIDIDALLLCSSLSAPPQMFLAALSFAYFAKALSGSYMKSTITQLERRFDIPSYLIGVIDGSFEIGEFVISSLSQATCARYMFWSLNKRSCKNISLCTLA